MAEKKIIETDVLVIGGGMAGWFAAEKARLNGAEVCLADKGYVGMAGQSPYAGGFVVFNEEWGDDLKEWSSRVHHAGEYLNNVFWFETVLKHSYERYKDLKNWGCEFLSDANGLDKPERNGFVLVDILQECARKNIPFRKTFAGKARKRLESIGVHILDRVMMIELLKENGRICGACGISVDSDIDHVIKAKTTILCCGPCGYKPEGYVWIATDTGDGEAMAFRAGAELTGKEFIEPMRYTPSVSNVLGRRGMDPKHEEELVNVTDRAPGIVPLSSLRRYDGTPVKERSGKQSGYPMTYLDLEFEGHEGRGPFSGYAGTPDRKIPVEVVSGATLGMGTRKGDGLWPKGGNCASSLPGLYAAGDALGTLQDGAVYSTGGGSLCGCAVTGAIAGEAAAEEAKKMDAVTISDGEIERALAYMNEPSNITGGYSPRWATQVLQSIMAPYFIYSIKKADRLEAALTYVMFLKEHVCPRLIARDRHELRLAHETRSMILSAEMRLRSGLFRTESRGMHYREDYPFRDDKNWLCWTKIVNKGGKVVLEKVPIPSEWMPDEALSYEERYPYRFPGEEEYLNGGKADGNTEH